MRPRKYHVTLTEDEHQQLLDITGKGKASAQKIRHAQILMKLDETFNEKPWTIQQIKEAYHSNEHTICSIAQRFVEEGMESALNRRQQQNRHRKITGEVEAHIIAIACSEASEGRGRWTLSMIADKLVELHVIDSISPTAVGTTLKKRTQAVAGRGVVHSESGSGVCSRDGRCAGSLSASL